MGMTPSIEIVLGISVSGEEKKHTTRTTKYDPNTGEPFEQLGTKIERVLPEWLDKLYNEEYDHGHVRGTLAAFDDNQTGIHFLVGKLIGLIDPRDFDSGVIDETDDDARAVWEWLRSVGCENVLLEDVKIRLRSIWF